MRRVALCMELSDFYEHGIARGVALYAKSRPDWRLYGYGWMFRSIADIADWDGDGIIARIESPGEADRLAALGLPVVDVAGAYDRPGFLRVSNDDRLTGEVAARHLLSCGFSRFAFLGVSGTIWSSERKAGFQAALARVAAGAGGARAALPSFERSLSWWERPPAGPDRLAAFLSDLEPPAAVFACNDTSGLRALEAAKEAGIAVPESLAVLGVDDEDILCELASPSMSSVALDCGEIGRRAAATLDALLDGQAPPRRRAVVPREVVERESTRIFACEDTLVSRAATFIRAHAHEGIGVPEILAATPASRRSLELRFRRALGRSLHEEIIRVRLERAKRLLAAGDLTVERVAAACGFSGLQRLHAAFQAAEGVSPGTWRTRTLDFTALPGR